MKLFSLCAALLSTALLVTSPVRSQSSDGAVVNPKSAETRSPVDAKKNLRLKAAYLRSLSFSPLFLALEKGYLRDEGVELELDIVQSASQIVAFLGTGQLDLAFGNMGAPLFNAAERGILVRAVGSMSYYPRDPKQLSPAPILISRKINDTGAVKDLSGLKGRKIAFNTRGGIIEYLVAGGLARVGLKVSDLEVVTIPFPSMAAAMSNGAVDAAVLPEPLASAAREQGVGVVLDPNPVPGTMATVLMFGTNLLKDRSNDAGSKVLRALRRAAAELSSPEEIMSTNHVALWAKSTEVPAALISKTAPYYFDADLAISVSDVLRQQAFLHEHGQISRQLPIDLVLDRNFAIQIP